MQTFTARCLHIVHKDLILAALFFNKFQSNFMPVSIIHLLVTSEIADPTNIHANFATSKENHFALPCTATTLPKTVSEGFAYDRSACRHCLELCFKDEVFVTRQIPIFFRDEVRLVLGCWSLVNQRCLVSQHRKLADREKPPIPVDKRRPV